MGSRAKRTCGKVEAGGPGQARWDGGPREAADCGARLARLQLAGKAEAGQQGSMWQTLPHTTQPRAPVWGNKASKE